MMAEEMRRGEGGDDGENNRRTARCGRRGWEVNADAV